MLLAFSIACLAGGPVSAQESPEAEEPAQEPDQGDQSEESLRFKDEVVVTAQKRTEALAEVPASVTVVSGQTLEQQRAHDFQDLASLVPGFSLTSSRPGVTRITLRGINTGGVASTVGVYVDNVPFGSSSGLANAAVLSGDFDTFDLARVEVLRGPQGTLYGASSLGGVLKYVPNAPSTERFEGRFLGSTEALQDGDPGYSATGLVNVPLSDEAAFRASGFYRFDDGFIDSLGNNPIPSLTDPGLNIVDGSRVDEGLNSLDKFGFRGALLFQPSEVFSLELNVQAQNTETGGTQVIEADPETLRPLSDDPVQSRYHPEFTDVRYRVFSGTLDWDLGAARVESVTSYSTFEQEFQTDSALATGLTGGPPLAALVTLLFGDAATRPLSAILPQVTSTDKFAQELRLVSPEDDTFEWLLGGYFTKEDSRIEQAILAVEAGSETRASGIPALADISLDSTYEEFAAFANATAHVTPRFDISFGARISNNEQVASQVSDGPLVGGLTQFDDATSSETPFTFSVSPRFELRDGSAIYARVATGFRPGGPNVLPPGAPAGVPRTYDSDTLTSYEAGLRTTSSDGRFSLDLSAFYLDWEDIQLLAVVNDFGVNGNGGTAESKGLELTASVTPTPGLTFSLNGAYTDAQLTQDTDPVVGGMDGDPLPYVPEWSFGLNGGYEWTVLGDSTAHIGGGVSYTGDRTAAFSDRGADGGLRAAESYTTLDLRGGLYAGRWSLEVYGRNLTNEMGVTAINAPGFLPNGAVGLGLIRPRTIGVSVGVRFWGS
jgi:outer membrane receptor protein involved in Fe transport